jgi:hypothetical protein
VVGGGAVRQKTSAELQRVADRAIWLVSVAGVRCGEFDTAHLRVRLSPLECARLADGGAASSEIGFTLAPTPKSARAPFLPSSGQSVRKTPAARPPALPGGVTGVRPAALLWHNRLQMFRTPALAVALAALLLSACAHKKRAQVGVFDAHSSPCRTLQPAFLEPVPMPQFRRGSNLLQLLHEIETPLNAFDQRTIDCQRDSAAKILLRRS